MTANTRYRQIQIGDLVKLRNQLQTKGGTLFAKGLTMKVVRKRKGLGLRTINNKTCKTCGIGQIHHVDQVPVSSVIELKTSKPRKKSPRRSL